MEVTAENVGPITDIRYQVYVPLTVRDCGGGPADEWTTVHHEDFEGAFPGGWTVWDEQAGSGEYYWARRSCRPYAGGHSGWAVGGGAALGCGSHYPGDARSWMVYSPFSLADATAAELTFQRWLSSEDDHDQLFWGASTDGVNYGGWLMSGASGGCQASVLDLAAVPYSGNLMGQPHVWVALVFASDSSVSYAEGAYVDELVLRKYVPARGQARTEVPPTVRPTAPQGASGISPAKRSWTWTFTPVDVGA